jgi:hypothetical protein
MALRTLRTLLRRRHARQGVEVCRRCLSTTQKATPVSKTRRRAVPGERSCLLLSEDQVGHTERAVLTKSIGACRWYLLLEGPAILRGP